MTMPTPTDAQTTFVPSDRYDPERFPATEAFKRAWKAEQMLTPTDAARRADIARYLTTMEQGARDATIEDCKWFVRFTAQPGNTAIEIEREIAVNQIADLEAALTAARAEVGRLTAEKRTAYILLDNIHRALMPDGIAFGQYTHAELIAMIRDATAGFTTPPTAADADGSE